MITRCKNRVGFTLVELLLAMSISIMVFAAMGMLLTKCFSLWKESTAQWRLAQYARISRERILYGVANYTFGGVTNQTGLLSATNVVVLVNSGWTYLQYKRADDPWVYQIYGSQGEASDRDLLIKRGFSPAVSALMSGGSGTNQMVAVDLFTASATNHIVTITYRLRLSAAGKTFYQQQTIETSLLNEE